MSAEQEKPLLDIGPVGLFAANVRKATEEFAVEKFMTALLVIADNRIAKPMVPEFSKDFSDVFIREMKDRNTVPIVVSSHQGHADLLSIVSVSKMLTDIVGQVIDPNRLPGWKLVVAASLRAGYQGPFVQQGLIQTEKDYLPKYNLGFIDYVRPKDVRKYKMTSNRISFMHKLIEGIEKDYGIVVFPEGSVESGRRKDGENESKIKGMQEINCEDLSTIIKVVLKQGKNPLLMPMACRGSSQLVDSNLDETGKPANKITLKEVIAILKNPISAKLGMPIRYDGIVMELEKQGKTAAPENLADFLGRRMAKLLPENERGVYA